MKKKFIFPISFLALIFIIVTISIFWYNSSNINVKNAQAQEQERRFFEEEVVVCDPEVPIGEAIEEALRFAYDLERALSNTHWAINEYVNSAENIADLAGNCDTARCSPRCIPEDGGCIANPCLGDPCPNKSEIANEISKLADISRILERERTTIEGLIGPRRNSIKEKLEESRDKLEKYAPTIELYQLLRGTTPCEIAINNYWVDFEAVAEGEVCKSFYNFLICR